LFYLSGIESVFLSVVADCIIAFWFKTAGLLIGLLIFVIQIRTNEFLGQIYKKSISNTVFLFF